MRKNYRVGVKLFWLPNHLTTGTSGLLILVVYRPAEGAGQHKNRRLRLGGKQKTAGCDEINIPSS